MILVWGIDEDATTASVLRQLDRHGVEVLFLDQTALLGADLFQTDIEINAGSELQASLLWRGTVTDLSEVSAAYLRPYDCCAFPVPGSAGVGSPAWKRALALDGLLWSWADISDALIVNRPREMAPNGSKPYQSRQIQQAGFAVPETLVTTEPQAAVDFWRRNGQVVYKSISGVRSIVSRLTSVDQSRWKDLSTCPVQFQQFVPGTDYRVHVVGDEVFGACIESDVDDYRYATMQGGSTRVVPVSLPNALEDRCRALSGVLGLAVSGIDLRRAVSGEWFCFEVNPSPAFSYFDTDEECIAAAVAALLVEAAHARSDAQTSDCSLVSAYAAEYVLEKR